MNRSHRLAFALASAVAAFVAGDACAQVSPEIDVPTEAIVVTLHAEGAQIYECKAGADDKLAWAFREPVATLLLNGRTVGRHYAGPAWEHIDRSMIAAKVAASVPGKTPEDLPWLRLDATTRRGPGALASITTVQRINTLGGIHAGPCDTAGTFHSAPYAADYVFLQKGG